MDKKLVNEIMACLPRERTVFRYFKDRYALILLSHYVGEGKAIASIRESAYAALLHKPAVKALLAYAGDGYLSRDLIENFWLNELYHFVLTVGCWGSHDQEWDQTSRDGYNLVLQLNFSNQHDGIYKKLVKPGYAQMLNYSGHPVLGEHDRPYHRETLAWARIDLDFESDEALIEEVQSDWVREAKVLLMDIQSAKEGTDNLPNWWSVHGRMNHVIEYCTNILKPYQKMWSEAILAAAIDFIRSELGIGHIYFHSEKTGGRVKKIHYTQPPRSIYSKLPEKFCFQLTDEAPSFLMKDKYFRRRYKRINNPEWFVMAV